MAIKDMLALIDDKLQSVFHKPVYDPTKARKPLLAGIDKTVSQFQEGKTKVPHRWWSVSNDVVEFAPKVAGSVMQINGKDTSYIPAERFLDFLKAFRAAVETGEFDSELENHGQGDAKVKTPTTRKASTGGNKGWSEERLAKFKKTIEARNAAKNA